MPQLIGRSVSAPGKAATNAGAVTLGKICPVSQSAGGRINQLDEERKSTRVWLGLDFFLSKI